MPQSDSQAAPQAEANEQAPDHTARHAAAAEERNAAALLARSRAQQEDPAVVAAPSEEPLISVVAKGREHLLQKMREHAAQTKAKVEAYTPPQPTDRQRERLLAEQEAGRRAQERHEEQTRSRPVPKKDPADGTSTPVMRPGNVVPDPMLPATGFAAGTRQYGADA